MGCFFCDYAERRSLVGAHGPLLVTCLIATSKLIKNLKFLNVNIWLTLGSNRRVRGSLYLLSGLHQNDITLAVISRCVCRSRTSRFLTNFTHQRWKSKPEAKTYFCNTSLCVICESPSFCTDMSLNLW